MAQPPQIHSLKTPDRALTNATRSRRLPWLNVPLIVVVALLVGYGLLVVYSAVHGNENYSFSRQVLGVIVGVVVMVILWRVDYRLFAGFTTLLAIISVVLILAPFFPPIAAPQKGAHSWVKIGMQFQPGEFARITVILLDAGIMARYGGKLDDVREYLKALGLILVPVLCMMLQPNLGTALVFLSIGIITLIAGGARTKFLLITLAAGLLTITFMFALDEVIKNVSGHYVLLKDYQRGRLTVFLDPSADTSGNGYNLKQAQIAVGSGGLFGKGFMQGSQHALGLLPESPTDFVFCVLAEELGFFGALVLLALYLLLILVCFRIASASADLLGMLIVMGSVGMWLFQIFENMGMTIGMMPITGIPLPFISYAPSFMVGNFAMLGIIGSVWAHNNSSGKKGGYATTR